MRSFPTARLAATMALLACYWASAWAAAPAMCDQVDEACAGDETPLLQVASSKRRAETSQPDTCKHGYPIYTESQCLPLLPELGPTDTVGWWNMPAQDLSGITDKLTPFDMSEYNLGPILSGFANLTTFGTVGAAEGAKLMYQATKVEQLFRDVPEVLRGVFWMKGNGVAEELVVMQYGRWFEKESIYIQAMAPFTWAWPTGKPWRAPYLGAMYSRDASKGAENAAATAAAATSISYKFSTCPSYAQCSSDGNPLGNMSFAYMQLHQVGNVSTVGSISDVVKVTVPDMPDSLVPDGAYTLEAGKTRPGEEWERPCMWGVGDCASLPGGGYNLQRIIDGKGDKVQPYFDNFVKYMGKVELLVWSGFQSKISKAELAAWYSWR